jgi:P-type conjugative transfer protein TrbJ
VSSYYSSSPRRCLIAGVLGISTAELLALSIALPGNPAQAHLTVFDPSNYSQKLLTAARTLQQINNQIRSLRTKPTCWSIRRRT